MRNVLMPRIARPAARIGAAVAVAAGAAGLLGIVSERVAFRRPVPGGGTPQRQQTPGGRAKRRERT